MGLGESYCGGNYILHSVLSLSLSLLKQGCFGFYSFQGFTLRARSIRFLSNRRLHHGVLGRHRIVVVLICDDGRQVCDDLWRGFVCVFCCSVEVLFVAYTNQSIYLSRNTLLLLITFSVVMAWK